MCIKKQVEQMDNKKLTPKQKAFEDYYIQLRNATESARRVGYKKLMYKEIRTQNLEKFSIKSYRLKNKCSR